MSGHRNTAAQIADPTPAEGSMWGWSSMPRPVPGAPGEPNALALCEAVIDILAAVFNVSGRDLRHHGRSSKPVARVRQIGMYVANVAIGLPMAHVARGFQRDRSTVVHACHLIEDMRDDPDFDRLIANVEKIVTMAFDIDGRLLA